MDQHKEIPLPRTARTAQTIGVIGIAEISEKNMNALLDDYLADKKAHFVIPVTNAHFSATVEMLVEYLIKVDLPFTAVTDGKAGRGIKSYLADAAETVTATDVGVAIVNAVKSGENGVLFSLWDDSVDDDLDVAGALEFAEENKVPVLDFCDGLVPVKFVDDESSEPVAETRRATPAAAADDPPFEPDPPKTPRAKAEPKAEADDDAPEDERSIPDFELGNTLGVRKLKRIAKNVGLVNTREVGPLNRDEVLELLYPIGGAAAPVDETVELEPLASVTTIVAKGGGTGATKGADSTLTITGGGGVVSYGNYPETSLRITALEQAVKVESRGGDALDTAKDFYAFLTGAV